MTQQNDLTPIPAQVLDGFLLVPQGTKPVFFHDDMTCGATAHVQDWTAEKEYDRNRWELYPLAEAKNLLVQSKLNGENTDQWWLHDFGKPTKEAMRSRLTGQWVIRDLSK
jgi:hypothetical protein